MRRDYVFTSESVTEGHPDKLCDLISDAILDRFLQQDPYSRIIAECAVANSILFIAARFASNVTVDIPHVARQVIHMIGYDDPPFSSKSCSILTTLAELATANRLQVPEEELSEEAIDQVPVRNQATVFGFACNHTPSRIPLPIWLAHRLARRLTSIRLQKTLPYLAPDGKTQVGVEFRNGLPYRIHSITILASQRDAAFPDATRLEQDLRETLINPVFAEEEFKPDEKTQIFINPDGPFITGGPSIHSGLTGRKNAIDTYGEYARQSGAALSGKDPTRIDRVGAYAARYTAKNLVAAGVAEECEIQLSYTIGLARPVSVQVETFGTAKIPENEIRRLTEQYFDFRLAGIIKQFRLRTLPGKVKGGFYRKLAAYGHVGRMDIGLPWELTDKASALREAAGLA
jgi:S-adenosylmethionine synthetase